MLLSIKVERVTQPLHCALPREKSWDSMCRCTATVTCDEEVQQQQVASTLNRPGARITFERRPTTNRGIAKNVLVSLRREGICP